MTHNRLYVLARDGLATSRLTSLLVDEIGPFEIFEKFRDMIGITYTQKGIATADNEIGKAFCCFWCASMWTALVIRVIPNVFGIKEWLATSMLSIAIEEWIKTGRSQ